MKVKKNAGVRWITQRLLNTKLNNGTCHTADDKTTAKKKKEKKKKEHVMTHSSAMKVNTLILIQCT